MGERAVLLPIEMATEAMNSAPVDVFGLAERMGLIVRKTVMGEDFSGSIRRLPDGRCEIEINSLHSPTRQRFTLAHEIAHYILHLSLIGDGITDDALYRSKQPSQIERQANRFAARMLMPAHLVRQHFAAGLQSPEKMARKFEVSSAVAEIRLRELGLIELAPLEF